MKSAICNPPSAIWTPAPWHGEFGWEVMSWAPWCRARSRERGGAVITSFAGMEPLYVDFASQFRDHGDANRTLDYPKTFERYRSNGAGFEHYLYGRDGTVAALGPLPIVLIHARGIRRKSGINYRRWDSLGDLGVTMASIGTSADLHVPGTRDMRGVDLSALMAVMAGASVTVGCSSGTMHLAAACGCDTVVWGDTKTRYNETLERRYKDTWNPHHVAVAWLDADDWQPEPSRILCAIESIVSHKP